VCIWGYFGSPFFMSAENKVLQTFLKYGIIRVLADRASGFIKGDYMISITFYKLNIVTTEGYLCRCLRSEEEADKLIEQIGRYSEIVDSSLETRCININEDGYFGNDHPLIDIVDGYARELCTEVY